MSVEYMGDSWRVTRKRDNGHTKCWDFVWDTRGGQIWALQGYFEYTPDGDGNGEFWDFMMGTEMPECYRPPVDVVKEIEAYFGSPKPQADIDRLAELRAAHD